MIPPIAERKIHDVLKKKISLQSFEKWLYEDNILESSNPNLYFELISFYYTSEGSFNYFYENFAKHVGFYKFEADRLKEYLHSIINRDKDCGDSIYMTYHFYLDGYAFFDKIGMVYGVRLTDFDTSVANDNLNNILDEFYPDIIDDAKNLLSWLDEGKIVFKAHSNSYDVFEYDDFRSEAEILQGQA
ncbi:MULTISPECIES: hypothetical protein [unclassified Psychrobacter]|uniref:hypothetical protein n=1 Tax=unclassified Psychrobacter TaxID=196806 RepID=UPI003FD003B6